MSTPKEHVNKKFINYTRTERKRLFQRIMKPINANRDKKNLNCGHVSLRLNELLSNLSALAIKKEDQVDNIEAVPTNEAEHWYYSDNTSTRVNSLSTSDPDILYRSNVLGSLDSENLNEQTSIMIDLTRDNATKPDKLFLNPTTYETIVEKLKALARRPEDNTAFGLVLYIDKTKKGRVGKGLHAANFFVDNNNEVYFLDAQPEKLYIEKKPLPNYLDDIFYICTSFRPTLEKTTAATPVKKTRKFTSVQSNSSETQNGSSVNSSNKKIKKDIEKNMTTPNVNAVEKEIGGKFVVSGVAGFTEIEQALPSKSEKILEEEQRNAIAMIQRRARAKAKVVNHSSPYPTPTSTATTTTTTAIPAVTRATSTVPTATPAAVVTNNVPRSPGETTVKERNWQSNFVDIEKVWSSKMTTQLEKQWWSAIKGMKKYSTFSAATNPNNANPTQSPYPTPTASTPIAAAAAIAAASAAAATTQYGLTNFKSSVNTTAAAPMSAPNQMTTSYKLHTLLPPLFPPGLSLNANSSTKKPTHR